jgi:hypothetical protein
MPRKPARSAKAKKPTRSAKAKKPAPPAKSRKPAPSAKKRGTAATQEWVITTSGDRSIGAIAKDLGSAGLTRRQVLKEIGSITGSASDKDVAKLRKVRGVADVSPSAPPVNIGPPDSDETW